jgi:hypothetical protein
MSALARLFRRTVVVVLGVPTLVLVIPFVVLAFALLAAPFEAIQVNFGLDTIGKVIDKKVTAACAWGWETA